MSSTSIILAKPKGTTLNEHNANLQAQADTYFATRPLVAQKYKRMTDVDLVKTLAISIFEHDQGKRHDRWQSACQREYAEYQITKKVSGKYLRDTKVRHEMYSLHLAAKQGKKLDELVRVAIAAHHGKLSERHQKRWKEDDAGQYTPLWESFKRLKGSLVLDDFDNAIEAFDAAILERYRYSGPRSLLQLFDHRASAHEDEDELPQFKSFNYQFPFPSPRGVQQVVTNLFDEAFSILRAPTGSGKTDGALLWAQHQIKAGRADRLVIAMPTRFTASSLAIATTKTLSQTGLYHSSAWFQRKDKSRLSEKEHGLARLLETPVTVTTIDHLCLCLTGRREDHHAIFFGLANSCVVIDEADFYDDFTQANMVMLLRALRLLQVPVLLMSATVPDSGRALYARSGFPTPKLLEDTTDATAPRCIIRRKAELVELPEDIAEELEKAVETQQPLIIYANTVKRAQAYYKYLIAQNVDNVVLYHSRFTEIDKADIEDQLRQQLGADAWKQEKAHGIAILTQIGELSVNISVNQMISDRCPLDRLVQRIGRLSRFRSEPGELLVVEPGRKGTLYPAPYGEYVNGKGWIAGRAFDDTNVLLKEGTWTRQQLVDAVDKLYPSTNEETTRVKNNRVQLTEDAVTNWLIVAERGIKDDSEEDEAWKCRDIPPQSTIYANWTDDPVDGPLNSFSTWAAFREEAQSHAIAIHAYEFHTALENDWIYALPILIGDDRTTIHCIKPQFYSSKRGVIFPDPDAE